MCSLFEGSHMYKQRIIPEDIQIRQPQHLLVPRAPDIVMYNKKQLPVNQQSTSSEENIYDLDGQLVCAPGPVFRLRLIDFIATDL